MFLLSHFLSAICLIAFCLLALAAPLVLRWTRYQDPAKEPRTAPPWRWLAGWQAGWVKTRPRRRRAFSLA